MYLLSLLLLHSIVPTGHPLRLALKRGRLLLQRLLLLSEIRGRPLAWTVIRAARLLAHIRGHEDVLQSLVKYAARCGDSGCCEGSSLARVDLGLLDETQHLVVVRIRLKPLRGSPIDLGQGRESARVPRLHAV